MDLEKDDLQNSGTQASKIWLWFSKLQDIVAC